MFADAVPNPTRQKQNRRNEPEKRSLGQNLHLSLNQSLIPVSTGKFRRKYLFSM
jgi:hypothetical protein